MSPEGAALREICDRLNFDERHRAPLVDTLRSYLVQRRFPGEFSRNMSSERRRGLQSIADNLATIAGLSETSTRAISLFVEDDDPQVAEFLEALQNSDLLRKAVAAVGRAIAENPTTKGSVKVEVRDRFLADLAVIYEDATGRPAAVSRNPIANSISGDFVDFVQAAHRAILPKEKPPSPAVIEHWTDYWRSIRGTVDQLSLTFLRIGG